MNFSPAADKEMDALITLLVWNREISVHGPGVKGERICALMIFPSRVCDSGDLSPTSCIYLVLAGLGAASAG